MADSFGAKARKFMGWPTPEDLADEVDDFIYDEEEVAEVTPLEPVRREAPLARVQNSSVRSELSRIMTVHPTSYSDARTIGEAFRSGIPVIVNLTDLNEAEARRIIDFAAGLTFGLNGVIERVTNRVFLLSPQTVEVEGDNSIGGRGGIFS